MAKRRKAQPSKSELNRYRRLYKAAAKRGLVKGDKDPETFRPTKYMKTKLNKIEPFLSKEYATVKVRNKTASKYRKAESALVPFVSGRTVVYRRMPGMEMHVRKGNLAFVRPLRDGEYEQVPIPVKFKNWDDLEREFRTNPVFNQLKNPDENWAFFVYENPSMDTFSTFDGPMGLIQYFSRYRDVIEAEDRFPIAFTLYREKRDWNHWGSYRKEMKRRRSDRHKAWLKQRRKRETDEQRAKRVEKDRKARSFRMSYANQKANQRAKYAALSESDREAIRQKNREAIRKRREKAKKK